MAKRGRKNVYRSSLRNPISGKSWERPGNLSADEVLAWDHVVKLLTEAGTLELTDPMLVEAYAVNAGLLRSARDALKRDGVIIQRMGRMTEHPATTIVNSATLRLKGIIFDLGLCPASSKYSAAKTNGESGEQDKWTDLLGVAS